jgi:hypothetical protein
MEIEDRLDTLENAHLALAAQHTALMAVCRVMLPLIPNDQALIRQVLTSAYDAYSTHMDNAGQDSAYQADVRAGIDLLSDAIYAVADISSRRRT